MSSPSIPVHRGSRAGFLIVLLASVVMMASASAPSPFYPLLQHQLGFSAVAMTLIFAVYALVLLAVLLTAGSISDHVGRRPTLAVGFLFLLAVAALAFDRANDVSALIAARAIQGIACGLLISTLSASVLDLEPAGLRGWGAVCNAVIPLAGLALGALVAGVVIDTAVESRRLMFEGLAVVSGLLAMAVWLFPETSPRHSGMLAALKPRLGVPPLARSAFWRTSPALFASWSTGGLYLSLGAPIMSNLFGVEHATLQGLVVALLAGSGAFACLLARRHAAQAVARYGVFALSIGTLLTLLGILVHSLALYLGALVLAGTGFGTAFYGVIRTVAPLSDASNRGELFAAIFTLCYLAFGVPAVIAGLAVPLLGLLGTVLCYGLVVAAMAALSGWLSRHGTQRS